MALILQYLFRSCGCAHVIGILRIWLVVGIMIVSALSLYTRQALADRVQVDFDDGGGEADRREYHEQKLRSIIISGRVNYVWSHVLMHDLPRRGSSSFLCHTMGRCLLQAAAAPSPNFFSSSAHPPPPPLTLPALPTPDTSIPSVGSPPPPPSPTVDPSFLSPPSNSGTGMTSKSKAPPTDHIAAKIGVGAAVGFSGTFLVILGLLYYFKPHVFTCCKTCLRVQDF